MTEEIKSTEEVQSTEEVKTTEEINKVSLYSLSHGIASCISS